MAIISIIIPAFNVQNNIETTLISLLNQESKDFEIIIVNDGSTDRTLEIINTIMKKSVFTNYKIISKENGGVSSARNVGLSESTGEYIFFLDGDDYVSNDFITTVEKKIKLTRADVIAWGFNTVSERKEIITNYFDTYSSNLNSMTGFEALRNILLESNRLWIWTSSAIYKKDLIVLNDLFYTLECSNGEDQEFTYKALTKAKEVVFINEVLSYYVQREGSISNSYNIKKFDVVDAFERVIEYLKNNSPKKDIKLIHYIEYQHTIFNYLHNFNSSIKYLRSNQKMSSTKAVKYVIEDINKNYPGMLNNINEKISIVTNVGWKKKILYELYKLSPIIYARVIK